MGWQETIQLLDTPLPISETSSLTCVCECSNNDGTLNFNGLNYEVEGKCQLTKICESKGLNIVRNLVGPYITSLEMQGCSITLLKMAEELTRFWDAPVRTPSLCWGV